MLVLGIIFGFLILLLAGFLFTPILFYADTDEGRYEICQPPLIRFSIMCENNILSPKFRFSGIDIPLKNKEKKIKTQKKIKRNTRSHFRRSFYQWHTLVSKLIKSFRIKYAALDIDTDDVILNAQLTPLLMAFSRENVHLGNNYNGRVYIHLEMYTKPARIVWIFIQFLLKK